MERIYLSPPEVSARERELLLDAFDSNWIAPLGPHVDAFEAEIAQATARKFAVATSCGTAALHLALRYFGVVEGDTVVTSSLTFAATPNAIRYQGATPVFVDSLPGTWNMDPALLREALITLQARGRLPRAVVPVDLYGQCADHAAIGEVCREFGIACIVDAAESLGAGYQGRPAGAFGDAAILSFNGNKIITTSGGGMLVTDDEECARKTRHWATQARDPAPHYEHTELGYNYRLSNLLSAIGRGQLERLSEKVDRRRNVRQRYLEELADLPGVTFMPEAPECRSTFWLTTLTIDASKAKCSRDDVIEELARENIEARPVWKPMHLQPLYEGCDYFGGDVSQRLFEQGLCLPSGSSLSLEAQGRVIEAVHRVFRRGS